jgi:hypothetical protein
MTKQKPKPDISLAKKTGHFNLLMTEEVHRRTACRWQKVLFAPRAQCGRDARDPPEDKLLPPAPAVCS